MVNEKIMKALTSAMTYLDNSMLALDKKNEKSLADAIWHIAAELEYALFLFSITVQDGIDESECKLHPKLKEDDMGSTLATVQDLLDTAKKCMENKELSDAYRNAFIARHYILKIQKNLSKKKQEALKKEK